MISLKRWSNNLRGHPARSANGNNLVRSNSFTLQLSPAFYDNVRKSKARNDNKNNNNNNNNNNNLSSSYRPKDAVDTQKNNHLNKCASTPMDTVLSSFLQQEKEEAGSNLSALGTQKVRYIFNTWVPRRPTSLNLLQDQLREVYLAYMSKTYSSVPCVIEIGAEGLRVQYAKRDGTDIVELFNPFHTIAYWAAVQCTVRAHTSHDGRCGVHIAFYPFSELKRPDEEDSTGNMFHWLEGDERNLNLLRVEHPPLFACVMRQNGVSRQLQCHVFLCANTQQAIALATRLYDVLKGKMKRPKIFKAFPKRLVFTAPKPASLGDESAYRIDGSVKKPPRRRRARRMRNVNQEQPDDGTALPVCSRCSLVAVKDHSLPTPSSTMALDVQRNGSFAQILEGLRRLALKDFTHKAANGVLRRKSRVFQRTPPHFGQTRAATKSPPASSAIDLLSNVKFVGSGDESGDDDEEEEVVDEDDVFHTIRVSREPSSPSALNKPHWMKILIDIGLRHGGAGGGLGKKTDERKPFFDLSKVGRSRMTSGSAKAHARYTRAAPRKYVRPDTHPISCTSEPNLADRPPQPPPRAASHRNGHHASHVPLISTRKRFSPTSTERIPSPQPSTDRHHSASFSSASSSCERDSLDSSSSTSSLRKSSAADGPRATEEELQSLQAPKKKYEEAYAEIQETEVSCETRLGTLSHSCISISERSLPSTVTCSIEQDAQLDDDDDDEIDSLKGSDVISAVSSSDSRTASSCSRQCPHAAKPQAPLAFRKVKPGTTIGMTLSNRCRLSGLYSSVDYETVDPSSKKKDSVSTKKDAEIISVIEQIVQNSIQNSLLASEQWDAATEKAPTMEESDGNWGWATFLP